jgi:hypothetical protein
MRCQNKVGVKDKHSDERDCEEYVSVEWFAEGSTHTKSDYSTDILEDWHPEDSRVFVAIVVLSIVNVWMRWWIKAESSNKKECEDLETKMNDKTW